jgi:hypothetical protein
MVPCGVPIASPQASGIEWVTEKNSAEIGEA